MEVVDIQNIKFTDNSFDLIFCNHVLEHIVDDNKAMSELHRVLKKSGKAFLTVPIDAGLKTTYEDFSIMSPSMRRVHFGQEDHVRLYGADFASRLENAGFKVDLFKSIDLGSESICQYALGQGDDTVFIGTKGDA